MTSSKLVIGTLALLAATVFTGVNETRLVRAQRSLAHGRRVAVALPGPHLAVQNDGTLVLISGLVTSNAVVLDSAGHVLPQTRAPVVMDPAFGIAVRGVRLLRRVEMLQWVETSHTSTSTNGGGGADGDVADVEERERVFTYSLQWLPERIDSSRFDNPSYRNPSTDADSEPWLVESATTTASDVVVGDFKLSHELIDQIQRREDVQLDTASRDTMRNILNQRVGEHWREHSVLTNVTIEEDKYFYWRQRRHHHRYDTSRTDDVGDLRVSFTVVPPYAVTICAQQKQDTLVPFATPHDEAGEPIFLLEDGVLSIDELFDLRAEAKVQKRLAGAVGFCSLVLTGFTLRCSRSSTRTVSRACSRLSWASSASSCFIRCWWRRESGSSFSESKRGRGCLFQSSQRAWARPSRS